MPGTIEDKRAASNITSTLSSYLMTAALGVIAAEAVIVTFIFDKREHLMWFFVFSGVGLASSVASIYFGGKGIFKVTKLGFEGDWVIKTSGGDFNLQSWSALIGIVLVAVSVFCGSSKPETPPQDVELLRTNVNRMQESLKDLESKYQVVSASLDKLSASSRPVSTQNRTKKQKK